MLPVPDGVEQRGGLRRQRVPRKSDSWTPYEEVLATSLPQAAEGTAAPVRCLSQVQVTDLFTEPPGSAAEIVSSGKVGVWDCSGPAAMRGYGRRSTATAPGLTWMIGARRGPGVLHHVSSATADTRVGVAIRARAGAVGWVETCCE